MGGYLLNFIVYTAAMIGVIFIAVIAYKKFSYSDSSKSNFLNVEDSITLAPRKNLFVVRAGNERFLIASDSERTTLISKLDEIQNTKTKEEKQPSVDDLPVILDFQHKKEKTKTAEQVLKNIANNI